MRSNKPPPVVGKSTRAVRPMRQGSLPPSGAFTATCAMIVDPVSATGKAA